MPRDVKIRTSYHADVAFLSRLARAIEMDPKLREGQKKRLSKSIYDLMSMLIKTGH